MKTREQQERMKKKQNIENPIYISPISCVYIYCNLSIYKSNHLELSCHTRFELKEWRFGILVAVVVVAVVVLCYCVVCAYFCSINSLSVVVSTSVSHNQCKFIGIRAFVKLCHILYYSRLYGSVAVIHNVNYLLLVLPY